MSDPGCSILSARYANKDHTAIIARTVEAGDVAASERDRPELWARIHRCGVAIEPYGAGIPVQPEAPRDAERNCDPLTSHSTEGTTQDMAKKSRTPSTTLSDDECLILSHFLEFAEEGVDEVAKYLLHVGITPEAISAAGDVQGAILRHYRRRGGKYDIDTAAADLLRWPPIAARVDELKRERRQTESRRSAK